jgi:hypothetical protein
VKPARRLAAVALAAAALLSACGSQAGAASVVGDRTITDTQVADYTRELKSQLASVKDAKYDEAGATQMAISLLTRDAMLTEVAARENITVTQGDVDTFLQQVITAGSNGDRQAFVDSVARDSAIPESAIPLAAHSQLVVNAIIQRVAPNVTDDAARSKALTDYLKPRESQIGVEVSPRFGTWNVLTIGPLPNDLSFEPALPSVGGGKPVPLPPAN